MNASIEKGRFDSGSLAEARVRTIGGSIPRFGTGSQRLAWSRRYGAHTYGSAA